MAGAARPALCDSPGCLCIQRREREDCERQQRYGHRDDESTHYS
jgi:hypothetical protein